MISNISFTQNRSLPYFASTYYMAPECKATYNQELQTEILRFGWIAGKLIANKVYESIGSNLLCNLWKTDSYLNPLQNSFNKLNQKVAKLSTCPDHQIFKTVQRTWQALKVSFEKEEFRWVKDFT